MWIARNNSIFRNEDIQVNNIKAKENDTRRSCSESPYSSKTEEIQSQNIYVKLNVEGLASKQLGKAGLGSQVRRLNNWVKRE